MRPEVASFIAEVARNIARLRSDPDLVALSRMWMRAVAPYRYTYNFTWLGRPIIQLPPDIIAIQEIVWKVKPDFIVETGVALGGSLVFSASLLELIGGDGRVLGVDVDIRKHNREELEEHPMYKRISLLQGSSTDDAVVARVRELAAQRKRVLVILDSNHTHNHVLRELELYSPLVGSGSYVIVLDTAIEDVPSEMFADRPWRKGNNPKTAVRQFLRNNDRFVIDRDIEDKLLITTAPDGYLRCVRDA